MNSYPTDPDAIAQIQQTQRQLQQVRKQVWDALGAIERAAESASDRVHGTPNAMKNGAGNAIDLVSANVKTTLKHSNPKRPARSFGYWLLMLGIFTAITLLLDACKGVVSGVANNEPLPYNAPAAAKASNATVRGIKAVSFLGGKIASEYDDAYRFQLVQQNGGQVPQAIPAQNPALDRSRILTVKTNVERYQNPR